MPGTVKVLNLNLNIPLESFLLDPSATVLRDFLTQILIFFGFFENYRSQI